MRTTEHTKYIHICLPTHKHKQTRNKSPYTHEKVCVRVYTPGHGDCMALQRGRGSVRRSSPPHSRKTYLQASALGPVVLSCHSLVAVTRAEPKCAYVCVCTCICICTYMPYAYVPYAYMYREIHMQKRSLTGSEVVRLKKGAYDSIQLWRSHTCTMFT